MTWMSIGAGRPKLRIWLTMSAGRNANEVDGNSRFSVSRSRPTYFAVGWWSGFYEMKMSASPGPTGAEVL